MNKSGTRKGKLSHEICSSRVVRLSTHDPRCRVDARTTEVRVPLEPPHHDTILGRDARLQDTRPAPMIDGGGGEHLDAMTAAGQAEGDLPHDRLRTAHDFGTEARGHDGHRCAQWRDNRPVHRLARVGRPFASAPALLADVLP